MLFSKLFLSDMILLSATLLYRNFLNLRLFIEYFPTQSYESFLNLFWISVLFLALTNLKIKKTLELTETNIMKLV